MSSKKAIYAFNAVSVHFLTVSSVDLVKWILTMCMKHKGLALTMCPGEEPQGRRTYCSRIKTSCELL
jgi:hypothetical protein